MKAFLLLLTVLAAAALAQQCQYPIDCGVTGDGTPCDCDTNTNLCTSSTGDACSNCGSPIGAFCYSATDCCADNCVAQDPGCDGGAVFTACSSCPTNCCDFVPSSECQVSEQQCDEPNGVCLTSNVEDGTPCTDGFCVSGVCQTQPCAYNEDCGECDCDTDLGVCVVAGCLACAGGPIGASCSSGRDCCLGNCIDGSCSSCSVDCSTQDFGECKVSTGCDEPTGDCLVENTPDGIPCSTGICRTGECVPDETSCEGGCTESVDYWKENKPAAGGDNSICGFTWNEWLDGSSDTDFQQLIQLYIAALANKAEKDACTVTRVDVALEDAEAIIAFIEDNGCLGVTPDAARRDRRYTAAEIIIILTEYNNGIIGPGACPPQDCGDGCVECGKVWLRNFPDKYKDNTLCGKSWKSWLAKAGTCKDQSSDDSDDSHDRSGRDVEGGWKKRWKCRALHKLGANYVTAQLNINEHLAGNVKCIEDVDVRAALNQTAQLLAGDKCRCRDNPKLMRELADVLYEFNNGERGIPNCPPRPKDSSNSNGSSSHDNISSSKSHKKKKTKHSSSS